MKETAIIMLTALGQEENIVEGLDAGADDYITKPFSFKVLMARIQSVFVRGSMKESDVNKSVNIVAIDLRYIFAVSKINNDLERVGDLASNIAEIVERLKNQPKIQIPNRVYSINELFCSENPENKLRCFSKERCKFGKNSFETGG